MVALKRWSLFLRRSARGANRTLAAAFRATGRVGGRCLTVVWAWGRARSWWYLAQGLPAALALVAVLGFLVRWMSLQAHEVDAWYQERATAASKAQDFPTALVCYERLAASGNDRPENLYEMALALAAHGRPDRSFEIMDQLAPIDRPGHGPAHLWLAVNYWRDLGDPQSRKRAEAHLVRALHAGLPDPDAAHGLLGELYAQSGRFEEAEIEFEHAVKSRPHVRLRYAVVLAAQKKKARADDEAKHAANYFKTRAQADVRDHLARIGWAEALAFRESFPQALDVLAEGHHLTNDAVYPVAMARVIATWHQHVATNKPDDTATQWNLLEKGLQLDSTNVELLNRLVRLMGQTETEAKQARALINQVLSKGEATATTHFLLGMDAWRQGKSAEAEIHWERANQLSPNLPMLANNLAWLLAHRKDPDLPRALNLSNRVIEKHPQDPNFRDTRARIYIKMGRWRDALPDLEFALTRAPNLPGIHTALAEVYGQLGLRDQADEHRRRADEAEKKGKAAKN
jgi:tetratricopeptide (TPR) repeat protein